MSSFSVHNRGEIIRGTDNISDLGKVYGGQKTILPTKDKNIIEFTDHHKW